LLIGETGAATPNALEIIGGRELAAPALANKVAAPDEPASPKDIPTPPHKPLEDSLHIAPEPNLTTVDLDSLKKHKIVFLHEVGDGSGWEWFPVLNTTNDVRRLQGRGVVAEVKFSDGKRNVDLESDELVYKKNWALLVEKKEGARAKKKIKPGTARPSKKQKQGARY